MVESLPLEGVRVLALENFIAGPVASMWLADAGAEGVKIEKPGGGDQARGLEPARTSGSERRSLSFIRANRNKKSVALDIKSPSGRAVLKRLIARADIVLENLNASALARLQLDYDSLSSEFPRLIYVSISGYGRGLRPSPDTASPAFDVVGQAVSGLMWRPEGADKRPHYLGFPMADIYASTVALAGTYQALYARERTGKGSFVDVSLVDGAAALNELSIIMYGAFREIQAPGLHALTAPFGAFQAKDGWVVIGVLGESVWQRFAAAIEAPQLLARPELANGVLRHKNLSVIVEVLDAWLASRTVREVVQILGSYDVPAAPVLNVDQVLESEHLQARGMLMTIDDPVWGPTVVAGNPVETSLVPHDLSDPPPALGADTADVLSTWIGASQAELESLTAAGAVGS